MKVFREMIFFVVTLSTSFAIASNSNGGEITDLNQLMAVDAPNVMGQNAANYLGDTSSELADATKDVDNGSFNYVETTQEYEPVAAGAGLLVNAKFNRYRREKALQDRADRSAKCTEKGLLRPENRHQDPRNFMFNPLSPNTYTAMWDYATGKHNPRRDQISQSYVNALNDGWYPSIGHREPLNCEKEEMQTPEWMKIIP